MMNFRLDRGFSTIEISIALIILGVVIAAGFLLLHSPSIRSSLPLSDPKLAWWEFDGQVWKVNGKAPECESPLTIASPVDDVTKLNAVLLPGQVRGTDFKPHGGLSVDEKYQNKINVSLIRDGYIYHVARYTAFDETQYLIDFIDACGVMVRYDHLATLTDEFMGYMKALPDPQPDDSRTHGVKQVFYSKGTLLATEVGIKKDRNSFFDLGVYDLRQPNAASKTELYQSDQLRIADKEQSFYALCWFDLLPEPDRSTIKALPERSGGREGTSDYCHN